VSRLAPPIERVIAELSKLPSIGRKTAQRLAFHLVKASAAEVQALARAIAELPEKIRECSTCFNLTEDDPCSVCNDPRRDDGVLCVVQEPTNLIAFERTGGFRGLYHVLGGALSPLRDVGPDDLHVGQLVGRIRAGTFREIILATNPNVEGEATAVYLARLLRPLDVAVTRLAQGLPAGSDLEFTDDLTLLRAFEGRRDF
jgi:recombination protein RecR